MKFQTDSKLQYNAKNDCYIFCILKIHELVGEHEFNCSQIKLIRKLCVKAEFIGEDGYINEKGISGIATVASGFTGKRVYIKRVESNDHYNYIIARFSRHLSHGTLVTHFVLMKDHAEVLFDPWSKDGARTTALGNITGYRYIWGENV